MVVHPLSIVMFAPRNDIANITTFHGIISVVNHKLVGCIEMAFVVTHGGRCFMMHHQLHPFLFSICVQHLHVEIRIGSDEIKHIIFWFAEPIFPAFIPAFYQYLIETMLRCKVDITFYFVIVGSMTSVRACLWIIRLSEFDGINIICICPTAFSGNHLPPHTDILHRFNPRNILISTWFVQIQG